jgi:protein CpxP
MKNTIRMIVAAAALAIAAPAYAQGGGGMQMSPAERAARQKDMLFKDITLTTVQSAKVDTIMTQAGEKQQAAMAAARSGGGDMATMRESMAKMNTERNDALKALLTDEQKKKFDENLAAMPQGRRGGL